eukprot:1076388-Prorocentrum_lima.AAC.1
MPACGREPMRAHSRLSLMLGFVMTVISCCQVARRWSTKSCKCACVCVKLTVLPSTVTEAA